MWKTVSIVGVGLIGGSIGLALRERKLAEHVVGIGRRTSTLRKARDVGAVTSTTLRLEQGVASADVVVVATPVDQIAEHVRQAAAHCPAATLITDAGSTKTSIVRAAHAALPAKARFVGSHPLAGSEKTGPGAAAANLFEGRVVVVTPCPQSGAGVAEAAADFWSALGATVFMMSPETHDEVLAATSHLPHVVASILAHATPRGDLPLTAGGWQDTTRIAAGDPELWTQILLDNRDNVLKSLSRFEKSLSKIRAALERGEAKPLTKLLIEAKEIREAAGKG